MAIDLHAHLAPRAALERRGWLADDGTTLRVRTGETWQAVPRALADLEALLADADAAGIGMRVVCLPPFLLRHDLPASDGAAYSRAMNDGLAAMGDGSGSRIRMLATVPLQDPPAAAEELRRAVTELGAAGAVIATNVAGRVELDDASLAPFWEGAASLGALVFIHPHDVAGAGRMSRHHLRNLVGNPLETALAGAALIFGGVLDRHPDLRILLSHGGGALPWLLGRLDHGYQVRPECRGIDRPPSEWARRFLYDTIVFRPSILHALVEWMGADRVVLGTDFPFDMSDPRPVADVGEAVQDSNQRQAILEGNAARLLARIPASPPAALKRGGER